MPTAIRFCQMTRWLQRTGASRSWCCAIRMHRVRLIRAHPLPDHAAQQADQLAPTAAHPPLPAIPGTAAGGSQPSPATRPPQSADHAPVSADLPRIDCDLIMLTIGGLVFLLICVFGSYAPHRAAASRRWWKRCRSRCGRRRRRLRCVFHGELVARSETHGGRLWQNHQGRVLQENRTTWTC